MIDLQATFSTLICHWWLSVVFGMLSIYHVPSMDKVVIPILLSPEPTFLQAPSSISTDNDSFFITQANLFLLPFLHRYHIYFSFNPSSSWHPSCWSTLSQPPALTTIPGLSHACPFCLLSSSLPRKLRKLSFIGLKRDNFRSYLCHLFSQPVCPPHIWCPAWPQTSHRTVQ